MLVVYTDRVAHDGTLVPVNFQVPPSTATEAETPPLAIRRELLWNSGRTRLGYLRRAPSLEAGGGLAG